MILLPAPEPALVERNCYSKQDDISCAHGCSTLAGRRPRRSRRLRTRCVHPESEPDDGGVNDSTAPIPAESGPYDTSARPSSDMVVLHRLMRWWLQQLRFIAIQVTKRRLTSGGYLRRKGTSARQPAASTLAASLPSPRAHLTGPRGTSPLIFSACRGGGMAYAGDLKSLTRKGVRVRSPPSA